MPRRRFTEEEDATITREWRLGTRVAVIGVQLGRSEASVDQRRRRLKLPNRRPQKKSVGYSIKTVLVHLSEDLHAGLAARAHTGGAPMSAYVRRLIVRDLGITS